MMYPVEQSTVVQAFPFDVTVAKPRKRPVRMGGKDASVFAMQGVPTIGFREEDVKGYTKENSILP